MRIPRRHCTKDEGSDHNYEYCAKDGQVALLYRSNPATQFFAARHFRMAGNLLGRDMLCNQGLQESIIHHPLFQASFSSLNSAIAARLARSGIITSWSNPDRNQQLKQALIVVYTNNSLVWGPRSPAPDTGPVARQRGCPAPCVPAHHASPTTTDIQHTRHSGFSRCGSPCLGYGGWRCC